MSKTRLTITISPKILQNIDHLIDGRTIRNRSHAIEYLLNKQLLGQVSQAIILAGGKKDAIDNTLSPISGQPVIHHLISLIKSYGINDVFILTDQPSAGLKAAVKPYPEVEVIDQKPNLGTAGALLAAKNILSTSPFLVLHADIFTDINLTDLSGFHQSQTTLATIGVKPKLNKQEFGKAIMHGNLITEFTSHPKKSEVGMVNTGVYLINPSALDYLKPKAHLMLETDLFPLLASERQLSGFLFEGIWYDTSK